MERRTRLWLVLGFTILVRQPLAFAGTEHRATDIDYRESPAPLAELTSDVRSSVLAKTSARAVMCSPIAELPTTSLCFFKTRPGMNAALSRIAQRLETKRALLTDREHVTNPANQTLDGHDLRVADIAWVLHEHDLSQARLAKDAAPANLEWMVDFERDFREQYLIPLVVHARIDVLLGLVADGDDAALHHELLHAAFFTEENYRRVVKVFWKGLGAEQRAAIKLRLAVAYDVTDETLVLNEVQAYLLMAGAQEELLGDWAHLAKPLLRALKADDISPPMLSSSG